MTDHIATALKVLDAFTSADAGKMTAAEASAASILVTGTAQVHALLAIADAIEKASQSHHFAAGSL